MNVSMGKRARPGAHHLEAPPRAAFDCVYARSWIDVKQRYGLTVDPAEKTALERLLGTC